MHACGHASHHSSRDTEAHERLQVVAGQPQQQAPAPEQQQQEELPPITQSHKELMAAPVKELKKMLQDRKIDSTGAAAADV